MHYGGGRRVRRAARYRNFDGFPQQPANVGRTPSFADDPNPKGEHLPSYLVLRELPNILWRGNAGRGEIGAPDPSDNGFTPSATSSATHGCGLLDHVMPPGTSHATCVGRKFRLTNETFGNSALL
ncbi:hypothetical protein EVAR_16824_1 [Eumeta japonica]|uniref:Uncharacterized protein n=1 Tax=Eumeta variegata TaxID=151549 RepID=A0A4C1V331_EUMVA|nr:hypothetical protein EVAR_16824_1 [Eumeta japonica]